MSSRTLRKLRTACVSGRVYVSHPEETAVVYIKGHEDCEGYVGWLATVATEDEAQEDCGALDLGNGEFFLYADDTENLSLQLELRARRLHFRFAQIIELTDNPMTYCITEL